MLERNKKKAYVLHHAPILHYKVTVDCFVKIQETKVLK